jgi:DNA-binding FrmR family transcriptional regulator
MVETSRVQVEERPDATRRQPAPALAVAAERSRRRGRGYASGKHDHLVRLHKIQGQVRALERMVETDSWCSDIVIQVTSATRALQEVSVGVLNDHIRHCVVTATETSPAAAAQELDDLAAMIRQVMRR